MRRLRLAGHALLPSLVLGLALFAGCSSDDGGGTTNPPPDRPSITSISPDTVVAGTTARLRGERFGSTRGSSEIWFGGKSAQSLSWSEKKILAVVPDDVASGNLTVKVDGQESDAFAYKAGNRPAVIAQIAPSSGPVGGTIAIEGRLFGVSKKDSKVFFGTVEAQTVAWGDSIVQATIPPGAQTGTVHLVARTLSSNEVPFTLVQEIDPLITSVEPDSGLPGAGFRIVGQDFTEAGTGGQVKVGGLIAPISSWSDTEIEASVPASHAGGAATVQVTIAGQSSNSVPFKVLQPSVPVVITKLEPSRTTVSDIITIYGTGFRTATIDPEVTFQGPDDTRIPTTITVWDEQSMRVWVPQGAVDGPVIVKFDDQVSEGAFFSVAPRRIRFTTDIHPLFEDKGCLGCHSGSSPEANLNLSTKFDANHGTSDHGPVIISRNGPGSIIVQKVGPNPPFGARMPFGCTTTCLSEDEILLISDWIDQGLDN
ncbi:MAG: IPT/TIG domain-containing protein [Candidatus Eisenbacteria bacterium]|nr:IPT/TIG domain-containing protein [Candidatus Eisenbacteria bacterium]